MKNRLLSQKGFSLIELMVVVAIIGILALASVLVSTSYFEKVRESNCRQNLQDIKVAQEMYYSLYDTYANSITAGTFTSMLSFDPTDTEHCKFSITKGDTKEFTAQTTFIKNENCWQITDTLGESVECP